MDETTSKLEFESDGDGEEYEVKAICNSVVNIKESDSGHLPSLYYLVSWKVYLKEKNTWEPALAVLYLCKLISTFHHNHLKKPIATSPPINSALPKARPTVKPKAKASSTKWKQSRSAKANGTSKSAKKSWTSHFYLVFGHLSIAGKRSSQSHDFQFRSAALCLAVWFSILPYFSIFTHLPVFRPRHRLRGFIYQSLRSFGFSLPVL